MPCIEEWLRDITDVFHEIHLKKKKEDAQLLSHRIQSVKHSICHKYGKSSETSGDLSAGAEGRTT